MKSYNSVGLRVLEVLNFRHMKTNQQNILNGTKKNRKKNLKKAISIGGYSLPFRNSLRRLRPVWLLLVAGL